jgi:hypothetical protein
MVWKKKEKPLSPEEAIAQAKKELAPFWFNSEPLLAAVKTETGAAALPLTSEFVDRPWLFLFVDPGEFSSEGIYSLSREWNRRYHLYKLGIILFLKPSPAGMFANSDGIRKLQLGFPVAVDHDGLFANAFKISSWPAAVLQSGSESAVHVEGLNWPADTEEKIQRSLRAIDPGLALPLSFPFKHVLTEDSRVDFGSVHGAPMGVLLTGDWTQGEDFIRTQDPQASLEITSRSPYVSIIGRSGLETRPSRIAIETPGGGQMSSLTSENLPEHAAADENGKAVVRIQYVGLYPLLKALPTPKRHVKLSFPDSATIPVFLYGLRFGRGL